MSGHSKEHQTNAMTLHKFLIFQNVHIYFPKFKHFLHFMTCNNGMTLRLSLQCKQVHFTM